MPVGTFKDEELVEAEYSPGTLKLRECSLTAQDLALPVLPLPLLASCTNQR